MNIDITNGPETGATDNIGVESNATLMTERQALLPWLKGFIRGSRGKRIWSVVTLLIVVPALLILVAMVRSNSSNSDEALNVAPATSTTSSTSTTIPVPPSDLAKRMCTEIGKRIWIGTEDAFGLDLDGDGWGCEEFSKDSSGSPQTQSEQIDDLPPDSNYSDSYIDDEYYYDPYCEDPYVYDPYCEEP